MATVGVGELVFEPVPDWHRLPSDVQLTEAVGVATDSKDRVYVFNRANPPVIVFESDGTFVTAWGDGQFVRPHGIWIAADDTLYLTDDKGHSVKQFSADGKFIRAIGPSGEPSDSGATGFDHRTITHGAGPFNLPTNSIVAPSGEIFVTDGYGNARVHHFSRDGELLSSWGGPGSAAGEFKVPHGLGVDRDGRIYVADRENSRIQIFSPEGRFITEWTDVVRPCEVFVGRDDQVYVAELGARAGLFPWMTRAADAIGSRVSIFDRDGRLLTRWGRGDDPRSPLDFYTAHDIWVDSQGSIYVGEVTLSAPKDGDYDPKTFPTLRKFIRV